MTGQTYILAPWTQNNFDVLSQAIDKHSDISIQEKVKTCFRRSAGDKVGSSGILLCPADDTVFIYMQATATEIDPLLLAQVTDYQLFLPETQPFNEYWI